MRSGFTGTLAAAWAVAGVMALGPTEASAAPPSEGVALLPLQVDGDLREGWQEQIEQALTRGFVQAGMEVKSPEDVLAASGGVATCTNAKCWSFLSQSTGARFLVRGSIEVRERNYTVSLDIIDGADGSMAAASKESCQLCGLSEVGDLVTSQAVALRQKVEVLALEPAIVAVSSTPAGATIVIDGAEVGRAPLEHELSPGSHKAEARKEGYIPQSLTIDAVKGVRETVSFELLPQPVGDDSKGPRKDWKVPVGWTAVGIGVAAAAAGGTFLGIDENPYRTRCSGPDVDAFGNCRQRYNTLVHGIALTAGGGALLITGAALLIAARVAKNKRGGGKASDVARRLRLGPGTLGARF